MPPRCVQLRQCRFCSWPGQPYNGSSVAAAFCKLLRQTKPDRACQDHAFSPPEGRSGLRSVARKVNMGCPITLACFHRRSQALKAGTTAASAPTDLTTAPFADGASRDLSGVSPQTFALPHQGAVPRPRSGKLHRRGSGNPVSSRRRPAAAHPAVRGTGRCNIILALFEARSAPLPPVPQAADTPRLTFRWPVSSVHCHHVLPPFLFETMALAIN